MYLKFWKGVTHLSFTAKKRVPLSGCHVPPALSYRTSRTSRTAQKTPGIRQGGLLPPADPEGAQPWRDHRCLARWSRHEVPKTPGKKTFFKMHDPARVSHLPVRQSVRHPSGVAGIEPHRNPESSGLRPSTSGLKNGHPCRGALYPLFTMSWMTYVKIKCVTPTCSSRAYGGSGRSPARGHHRAPSPHTGRGGDSHTRPRD